MLWCPKCKHKYEEGIEKCPDCHSELEIIDDLSDEDLKNLKHLINVGNINEANIISGLLKANGIPAILKHKGIGEYLQIATGMTYYGVDIYVPSVLIEQAKELLKPEEE